MGVRESWEPFCAFNNKMVSGLHFRERTKIKGGKSSPIRVKIVVPWPMNLVIYVTLVGMNPSAVFAENPMSIPPICVKINCRP